MARRGENLYKREDGRFEGRYIKGRKTDGKIIYGYVYDKKLSDCKEKLNKAKLMQAGKNASSKVYGNGTVSEFMDYWLHSIVDHNVKQSTISNYEIDINKWIVPYMGKHKLNMINTETVQQFVSFLLKKGISTGTVRNIFSVFRNAMQKAFEYDYICRMRVTVYNYQIWSKKKLPSLPWRSRESLKNQQKQI